MKCTIFASAILAASTVSALSIRHEKAPRAVNSPSDITVEDTTDSPLSKADFARLYDIVDEFINNEDYVGLAALNFLTGDALEDFESNSEETEPTEAHATVAKRNNRSLEQQFSNFGRFFGGGRP